MARPPKDKESEFPAHLAQKIEIKDVSFLKPYDKNARTHSETQLDEIAASIAEFGFVNPILVQSSGVIIAGHGRLEAATSRLEMKQVPVIILDHLSEKQARALVIADNKLGENAGWDESVLAQELHELEMDGFDLSITGFDSMELEDLLAPFDELPEEPPEEEEDDGEEEDFIPEVPVSALDDVWILGNHRLVCGDSGSDKTRELLLQGEKVDMVFTDPPYNIDYEGVNDTGRKIKNDKMSDKDFVSFLKKTLLPAPIMYVCFAWQVAHLFRDAMVGIKCTPKAKIVWDKVNPAQNLDKYFKQYEEIYYFGPFGGEKTLSGDIWVEKRQQNTVHPTMKPVELIERALSDNPKAKVVFDGFGGSGSTLMACENKRRYCRTIELDPAYCDVIVNRWQKHTGKKAILETSGKTFANMKEERLGG